MTADPAALPGQARPDEQPDDIFAEPARYAEPAATHVARATDLAGVLVLKHDDLFLLTDAHGDVERGSRGLGLYDGDTRFLSLYELRINGSRPVVLRSAAAVAYRSTIQLTNPDLMERPTNLDASEVVLRRHSLGVVRERLIADGFSEVIRVGNFTTGAERARLTLRLDADFADIFEVRGLVRDERGERLPNDGDGGHVVLGYRGLDGVVRRTHLVFDPPLELLDPRTRVTARGELQPAGDGEPTVERLPADGPLLLVADWQLRPGEYRQLKVNVWSEIEATRRRGQPVAAAPRNRLSPAARPPIDAERAAAMHRAWRRSTATVETSHLYAQRAIDRALDDLRLLLNNGPADGERYIAAGVPWFCTLFGRDSLITAMQLLAVRPQLAEQTLSILARLQARKVDAWRDAEPGKILHELRTGEVARTGEIPHSPYYGTVDATPLWLMLLDEYQRWTADDALVERLWPNALACLRWIDRYGDRDGDGFVEYERHSRRGLANQGWKDSSDSMRHRDGTLGEAPIALVEVQAYVYAARRAVARLARARGDEELARQQEEQAQTLRGRFEEAFWMADVGTYALGVDASKRQIDGVASNAGHVLWAGLCSPERAASVARVLTTAPLWSGWGIRTLSAATVGYNPIGYHLGSIWPHDNAICAAGFARYGLSEETRKVTGAMIEAAGHFRDSRLPELFCGFDRATSPQPVPYPVACSPQAWSAGAVFQMIAATLGMRPAASERRLELVAPALPEWLPDLRIQGLRVGEAVVDLAFAGGGDESVSVEVLRRTGDVDIVVRL
ncbi:MAG: amylo-alpha-1,6-glucosidase [Chloroflexota bacterium]|nr:amylo-alpha-1,6-glucosidase [Chloroflexota bacterium]